MSSRMFTFFPIHMARPHLKRRTPKHLAILIHHRCHLNAILGELEPEFGVAGNMKEGEPSLDWSKDREVESGGV